MSLRCSRPLSEKELQEIVNQMNAEDITDESNSVNSESDW